MLVATSEVAVAGSGDWIDGSVKCFMKSMKSVCGYMSVWVSECVGIIDELSGAFERTSGLSRGI